MAATAHIDGDKIEKNHIMSDATITVAHDVLDAAGVPAGVGVGGLVQRIRLLVAERDELELKQCQLNIIRRVLMMMPEEVSIQRDLETINEAQNDDDPPSLGSCKD